MPLNPLYLASLTARNRLADARMALHALATLAPAADQPALLAHYNALCALQGQLESYSASIPHSLDEEESADADPA
jgi:hypothetical protein